MPFYIQNPITQIANFKPLIRKILIESNKSNKSNNKETKDVKKSKDMKVIRYKLDVTDSPLSSAHGFFQTITEFYVPDLNISFNIIDTDINCFIPHKTRYSNANAIAIAIDTQEILTIPTKIQKCLSNFIKAQENLKLLNYWVYKTTK